MGHQIDIENVSMRFGSVTAVTDLNVSIRPGEFFSFLGPSGCGKTTLLRLISGFLDPTEGCIRINGRDMAGIGPNKRPTAMIFQNLALFPLMTVEDNIGFGLEVKKVRPAERRARITGLLELVDLPHARKMKITELSGGQKQRVAIARALAVEPSVLLLDEPLSALDLKLRKHMRSELRQIQQKTGVTFIYITHDQGEALTMSDRVGVISQGGVLEQVDSPQQIYDHPGTAFVASFVGENNAIEARSTGKKGGLELVQTPLGTLMCKNPLNVEPGCEATVFIRPEAISFLNGSKAPANVVEGRVESQSFEGACVTLTLNTGKNMVLKMSYCNSGFNSVYRHGDRIKIQFSPESARLLPSMGNGHARIR